MAISRTYSGTEDKLLESTEPNIGILDEEYRRAFHDRRVTTRITENDNVRYALWEGQSEDGKKRDAKLGKKALPWDGASDTRIRSADDAINWYVDMCYAALVGSDVSAIPTEASDIDLSENVGVFMEWQMKQKLRPAIEREARLFLNYAGQYGHAYMHYGWDHRTDIVPRRLSLESIATMLLAQGEISRIEETIPWIENNTEYFAAKIADMFEELNYLDAKRCIKDLKADGYCNIPIDQVVRSEPYSRALRPYHDIVIPPETQDFQRARAVFWQELYTIEELQDKVTSDGWDQKFVDAVKQTSGISSETYDIIVSPVVGDQNTYNEKQNLIKIVWAYTKRLNDKGQTAVYKTIFSPNLTSKTNNGSRNVTNLYAVHEEVGEYRGQYPFLVFTLEDIRRNPFESRGIPEVTKTWQDEEKAQSDAIVDYTSMATCPPITKPKRWSQYLSWGPNKQFALSAGEKIDFVNPPSPIGVEASLEVIDRVRTRIDRRYGIPNPMIPPQYTQIRQQVIINRFIGFMSEWVNAIWRQFQKYGSDAEFSRVTGMEMPLPRDEHSYDIRIGFDAQDLDPELIDKKLRAIQTFVLPTDTQGTIDNAKLSKLLLRTISPTYARAVVSDNEVASRKIYNEVMDAMISMAQGNAPLLTQNDPAAQVKLQMAGQILEANPKYQEQLAEDQVFAQNLEMYLQSLQHSVMQLGQNRQTGKYGATPGQIQQANGL